jgi:hypothetical protein
MRATGAPRRRSRGRREAKGGGARARRVDLSDTEWPESPDYDVINAAVFAARGSVDAYPDHSASKVRELVADRHGLAPQQVVLRNGAGELLQTAALALLSRGDELVTPWPSYPLYPLMARRAGAQPVVPCGPARERARQPGGPAGGDRRAHARTRHLQPFTSDTTMTPESDRLRVNERWEGTLRGAQVRETSEFEMRCWTKDDLERAAQLAGFRELTLLEASALGARDDRLVAVALR